jgi:hypothetical protein
MSAAVRAVEGYAVCPQALDVPRVDRGWHHRSGFKAGASSTAVATAGQRT